MPKLSDEWSTPTDFWGAFLDRLKELGYMSPTLDVCATAKNTKCAAWFDKSLGRDGLVIDWQNSLTEKHRYFWCNPGYSKIKPWIEKATQESVRGATTYLLTLCDPSTLWWDLCHANANECWLLAPRINFIPPPRVKDSKNNKPNTLWIFRPTDGTCRYTHWRWK